MEEDEEEKPGDTYVGSMNHGKREGTGKYTWTSGAVYEGSYNDNKKQGQGVMTFPDKGKYEGTWEDDKMHGDGSYYYANGDIYAGSFREGKKHGKGMYYFMLTIANSLAAGRRASLQMASGCTRMAPCSRAPSTTQYRMRAGSISLAAVSHKLADMRQPKVGREGQWK